PDIGRWFSDDVVKRTLEFTCRGRSQSGALLCNGKESSIEARSAPSPTRAYREADALPPIESILCRTPVDGASRQAGFRFLSIRSPVAYRSAVTVARSRRVRRTHLQMRRTWQH